MDEQQVKQNFQSLSSIPQLHIGTSGWIYKHWMGIFYPQKLPASEQLSFYAQHFDTVEVNFSFYRLPELSVFETWRNQTPDSFLFAVKGSRFLTHMKKLKNPEEPFTRNTARLRGKGGICSRLENENKTPKKIRLFHPLSLSKEKI